MIPMRLFTLLPFLFMPPAGADGWMTTKSNNDFSLGATKIVDYYEAPARVALSSLPDRWRYAASGTLTCQGLKGAKYAGREFEDSAQLTSNGHLITTVAHMFNGYDTGVCERIADPSSCVFTIKTHGATRSVRAELIESGITCPDKTGVERDWSVMRLPCEVDDVEPYSIDPNKIDNLNFNDAVATVAQSIDFQGNLTTRQSGPLHFSQCSVLRTYGGIPPASVSTACGCSAGCSGGALLSPAPKVTLLGVLVQIGDRDPQPSAKPKVVHWERDGNGTYFALITREFRDALTRQAAQNVKLKSCFSGSD